MQADVEMLRKQREGIEDSELEFMERREDLDRRLAAAEGSVAELHAEAERLQGVIAEAEREIDAEIAEEEAARAAEASTMPSTLVSDYERRRAQNR